jgi:outer membrane protein OmpA-like peptidoglycan-associated protein
MGEGSAGMNDRAGCGAGTWLLLAAACVCSLGFGSAARAQPRAFPLRLRASGGAALMLSKDQVGRLGYSSPGGVLDLQLGYAVLPWLDVQLAVNGGAFRSSNSTGGLLSPLLGAAISLPGSMRPYLQLDVGPGFTGGFTRPLFRAAIGLDVRVSRSILLGPILGYGHLFQINEPGASTDARFLWFGIVTSFAPTDGTVAPHSATIEMADDVTRRRIVTHRVIEDHATEIDVEPAESLAVSEPSPALLDLLESAVPKARVELLAPVLFQLNSSELEPIGVAMLHEVARELAHRPDIHLIEVEGYADPRGDVQHNIELSQQRAERVVGWLVAHGVAAERLRVAAHGATNFVESGESEDEQQQNRRVVFRVIEEGRQP